MMRAMYVVAVLALTVSALFIDPTGAAVSAATQPAATQPATTQPALGEIRVGMLRYGDHDKTTCFSDGFLADVARETHLPVDRHFHPVTLDSKSLFHWPLVVMTGHQKFSLSKSEQARFKRYLEQGGFILASAGCSSAAWHASFQKLIEQIFGKGALKPVLLSDPVFHTLFDIKQIQTLRPTTGDTLLGLRLHGHLVILFSPVGLNDTADAGHGCCCCGGNELRNARAINADVLAYVLTH